MKFKVNASVISLVVYCGYGFFNKVSLVGKLIDKRALVVLGIMMLFVTIFYVAISTSGSVVFKNDESTHLYRVTIYCIMLVIVLLIFGYQTLPLLNQNANEELEVAYETTSARESKKYEKSYLTESQMDVYEGMLNDAVISKELFLDPDLSLAKLSLLSKIPPHHLTQILNTRLNSSFYNYINYLRIRYACELMEKPAGAEMSLEEIVVSCGFNSKGAFNRNFKVFMRSNPSDYRRGLE